MKIKNNPITIERLHWGLLLSTDIHGEYFKMKFSGYNKKDALRLFKSAVEKEKQKYFINQE